MQCSRCGGSLEEEEEVGGTPLNDCHHFLCFKCLSKAVGKTKVPGVRCHVIQGRNQCDGYLSHDDIESMVPEEVFANYLERICNRIHEDDDDDDDDIHSDITDDEDRDQSRLGLTEEDKQYGWAHKLMTLDEIVKSKGCTRKKAEEDLEKLLIWETQAVISCSICMDDEVAPGQGVVIKECFHMFCKDCLANLVEHNDEATVKCPYIDGNYSCIYHLQQREIRGLVTDAVYEKYLEKTLKLGESSMENSFHCKTPDCSGWCVYDTGVIRFDCPLCRKPNCIKCQVIHDGTCEDYKNQVVQNANDKLSQDALEELVRKGEYMRCPKCQIPVQKVVGCDWLQCTCCKTEICWVTRGPRWGPKGRGDTSGGCRCRANGGALCHPQCGNCH